MLISHFDSTAIESIELVSNKSFDMTIIFKNSNKSYNYIINNEDFRKNLLLSLLAEASIGRLINKSIKNEDIVALNTGKVWYQVLTTD